MLIQAHNNLKFGKHAGKSVQEVLKTDPHYLRWLHKKSDHAVTVELQIFIDIYCRLMPDLPDSWGATEMDIY